MAMVIRTLGRARVGVGHYDSDGVWDTFKSYNGTEEGAAEAISLCNYLNGGTGIPADTMRFIGGEMMRVIKEQK
jgi:hypothetical protein